MIEVFFDCSSPFTYLAFHAVQDLSRELDVPVAWKPFLVGGVFNTINPSVYAFRQNPVPAKEAYMRKDLDDWARHYGLRIKMYPSIFPINTVKAMRGCIALEPEGKLIPFATAVFERYWGDDEDVSSDDVLRSICRQVDVDPEHFFQAIARDDIKAALRRNTEEIVERGGFGSPTMFVDGDDMYFGNDRMPLIRAAVIARRAASGAAKQASRP